MNRAARWFAPAFPVVALGLALALAVSACSREPCTKLGHHPWSPSSDAELITSGPKPRCAATDPTCGPEAYDSKRACYDPSASRLPIQAPNDDGNTRQRCAHDGECVLTACTTCTHYSVALSVSCEKKEDGPFDEDALCGCLDGGCWFFRN